MSSSAFGAEIVWSVPEERTPLNGGVHGRMMEQREIAPSTSEWFLIANQGDMVVRIRPGMLLGETAAGEITFFNPSCAQLELDIAYDGSALLSAVDNYELEFTGGKRSRREYVERHRRAEIRLPHNVLQLDTDFANPLEDDDTVEIRIVGLQQHLAQPDLGWTSEAHPGAPANTAVAARAGVHRQQPLNLLMAAVIGLAAIGLAFLYPVLREDPIRQPPETVDAVPALQTDQAQTADLAVDSPVGDNEVHLSTIRVPPLPRRLLELPTPGVTEIGAFQQLAEPPIESLPEPEPAAAPAFEPNVRPPVEHGSNLPVAETTGEPAGGLETEVARAVVDTQADRPPVAEVEETGERSQALTEALAQWQDLRAADLALAQGRLTSPPESSAYTLFNRVLAQNPDSPEAISGLQSVRQRLINRALAQLAGGELGEARSSLQAAADAGADPKLVTDLHAEIDYRQQLTDARNQ